MTCCPKCGSKTGLQATHLFTQLYDWNGEPSGYEFDRSGTMTAVCCDCGKRFKLSDLEAAAKHETDQKSGYPERRSMARLIEIVRPSGMCYSKVLMQY